MVIFVPVVLVVLVPGLLSGETDVVLFVPMLLVPAATRGKSDAPMLDNVERR